MEFFIKIKLNSISLNRVSGEIAIALVVKYTFAKQ